MRTRAASLASAVLALATLAAAPRASALEITQPSTGTRVTPGATTHVEVTPGTGESVVELHGSALGDVVAAPAGSLALDVPIPRQAVGPIPIAVSAAFADGSEDLVYVMVDADPGPLDRLELAAPAVLDRVGEMVQLHVQGDFADGVARDLTDPGTGTTYTSSDPAVLAVDCCGRLQARTRGTAQILVQSRGRSAVATVQVSVPSPPDDGIPTANAGPDQTVPHETVVDLDGTGSQDPDGDALTFSWAQTAGPFVMVRDIDTAHPYFLAPAVDAPTALEFSLQVTDPHGARSFPALVQITVTP